MEAIMGSPKGSKNGQVKIYGVTHRGTDGETRAYMEDGRVWISDGKGGWLRCNPGVEDYFSPNAPQLRPIIADEW